MLESHPFAARNAKCGLVVAEGNLHAVHREVAENNEEHQRRNQQHPQLPVPADGALKTVTQAVTLTDAGLHLHQYDHSHTRISDGASTPFLV